MKWPKGPVGVVLGIGLAVLVAAAAWAGARLLDRDEPARDVPSPLPAASVTPTIPAETTGATIGDRGALATEGAAPAAPAPAGGPAATTPPASGGKTAFTDEQAMAFVGTFLGHLQGNRTAEARAMATARFAEGMGPTFFDRSTDPLEVVEVLMATREGARWNVYCGEMWGSGPRQTRYGLAETGGKLYIDSFEIAELP